MQRRTTTLVRHKSNYQLTRSTASHLQPLLGQAGLEVGQADDVLLHKQWSSNVRNQALRHVRSFAANYRSGVRASQSTEDLDDPGEVVSMPGLVDAFNPRAFPLPLRQCRGSSNMHATQVRACLVHFSDSADSFHPLSCCQPLQYVPRSAADSDIVSGQPLDRLAQLAQVHPRLRRVLARCTKAHFAAQRRRQVVRARIVFVVVLELVQLSLAAAVWFIDRRDGKLQQWAMVPVVSWLLVAASIVPTAYASHVAVWIICAALEAALDKVLEHSEYIMIELRTGLWFAPET